MIQKYPLIAAAVAAALTSGYAVAQPSMSQAASPTVSLVIAGSSAAATGVKTAIQTDICGSAANTLTVGSNASSNANKNFFAYSCLTAHSIAPTGDTAIPAATLITIYYRTEGGSVVGALPIAANHTVLRLNLGDSTCTAAGAVGTCTVTGVTATNGPSDSWNGAVVADTVQLGVTDVEPSQLTGADSPLALPFGSAPASVAYKTTAFGGATTAQMGSLGHSPLYQQVFGLAVNVSGESFSSVNLDRETAANILLGNIADWHKAIDPATGNPISATSAAITNIDREYGSGTRTGANIYFEQYCNNIGIAITNRTNLNYSTSDDLTAANAQAGSITYTAIDQIQNPANGTNYPNLVLASINGVAPSNLAAATGQYDYWFEATFVPNSSLTGQTKSLSDYLQANVPLLAGAPASPAVDVIPGVGTNVATYPIPTNNGKSGTSEVYVNQFTRNGASCNVPKASF
jgi:hypothetical protein